MRIPSRELALVPAPSPLRSDPSLFHGHPLHRRTTAQVGGETLTLRPVVPGDAAAIERFVSRLSPRSRFLRFHAAVRRLTGPQLAGLVDVDHHERETVVVADPDGRLVAFGQYVSVGDGVAELALAVADDRQRSGLGTRVVAWLADAAREEGLRAFTASVMAENRAAVGLFGGWPGSVSVDRHGTTIEVLLSLDPLGDVGGGSVGVSATTGDPGSTPTPA